MSENTDVEQTTSVSSDEDPLPGYQNVADFTKDGFKCLMEGIKHANSLPTGRDWNFYTTFESFKKVLSQESQQILDNITLVLRKNEVAANMRNQTVDKKTEILIDANDAILERVANNIDEMNGIRKKVNEPVVLQTVSAQIPTNINGSWNRSSVATFSVSNSVNPGPLSQQSKKKTIRLLTAENIVRPQKFFKDKIDNRNDYPWEPRIKEKPNSLKPLAIFLEETAAGREYSHPYEFELDRFTPSDNMLVKTTVIIPKPITETPLVEIDEPAQLPGLVEELRQFKTIAIDLEHHSYRSFMGITCLMQISTTEKDYLIDTLALRNDLWILNEIFTKADVVKVFHGAESDIVWLQRDLSLYIVNMFDTYFAAKQLEYSGLSLAYLMQRFCNFLPDKKFQLADWRIRPLPDELKSYAREDTHYLIYIYQNMKNELIDKANGKNNLLKAVIDSSTTLCKKRYFKPFWHENSHLEFYSRCHRMFDNRQLYALKEIFKWRDTIARLEDESCGYVLPNNMLLEIAGRLPKEMQGILACCSPVPPMVKANLLELHKIILRALEKPYEEPILKEDTRARGSTKKMTKLNVDSPLHCPHDLTQNAEFRDDLPTLLNSSVKEDIKKIISEELELEQSESVCSVFNKLPLINAEKVNMAMEKLLKFKENFKFLGPIKRYQLVKPFIAAKERRLAEEKAKKEAENEKKQAEQAANSIEDNRTDEERIESIREHFLQLAAKTLPVPPKKMSLIEMGGSKKRKRDDSILEQQTESDASENLLQTPVPNLQITLHTNFNRRELNEESAKKGNSGKRKSSDNEMGAGPSKFLKLSKRERNKTRMMKRKEKKALAVMRNEQSLETNDSIQESEQSLIDVPQPSNSLANRGSSSRKRRRGRGSFRGSPKKNSNEHQNELSQNDQFNAYDYSMVDFRQFQGGGRGTEKGKEFKTRYRGKGKNNKRGGKGHKAMSFGRGRER